MLTRLRYWLANLLVGEQEFRVRRGAYTCVFKVKLSPDTQLLSMPLPKAGTIEHPLTRQKVSSLDAQSIINEVTACESYETEHKDQFKVVKGAKDALGK